MTPEELTVQAFVASPQKQRMLGLLASPKNRRKVVAMLDHFHGLDERFAERISPQSQNASAIILMLRDAGAPKTCFVLSSDLDLDGSELPIEDAVEQTLDGDYGTFLICIPGHLAFFQGEEPGERYLLRRS